MGLLDGTGWHGGGEPGGPAPQHTPGNHSRALGSLTRPQFLTLDTPGPRLGPAGGISSYDERSPGGIMASKEERCCVICREPVPGWEVQAPALVPGGSHHLPKTPRPELRPAGCQHLANTPDI